MPVAFRNETSHTAVASLTCGGFMKSSFAKVLVLALLSSVGIAYSQTDASSVAKDAGHDVKKGADKTADAVK